MLARIDQSKYCESTKLQHSVYILNIVPITHPIAAMQTMQWSNYQPK